MRSEEEASDLINLAIYEVIEAFDTMSDREREMLTAATNEQSTGPFGRVKYLRQMPDANGVSEQMRVYVNQVLQTLRQRFSPPERERFGLMGRNILEDIE